MSKRMKIYLVIFPTSTLGIAFLSSSLAERLGKGIAFLVLSLMMAIMAGIIEYKIKRRQS